MLDRIRMRKVEQKNHTTKCEPCDAPAPVDSFYPDTGVLNSLPFDTDEFMLSISDKPFVAGEVDLLLPPLPFVRSTKNKTRFEIQNARGRRLRSSPKHPVTQAFVNNDALDVEIVDDQRPIYFGISAVTEADAEPEKQPAVADIDVGDEIDRADALVAFDDFLRESVRVQWGGRLTSRQIWEVWAGRWGVNSNERLIAGVTFGDVSRRFRATFGATTAKNPTRIDGIPSEILVRLYDLVPTSSGADRTRRLTTAASVQPWAIYVYACLRNVSRTPAIPGLRLSICQQQGKNSLAMPPSQGGSGCHEACFERCKTLPLARAQSDRPISAVLQSFAEHIELLCMPRLCRKSIIMVHCCSQMVTFKPTGLPAVYSALREACKHL